MGYFSSTIIDALGISLLEAILIIIWVTLMMVIFREKIGKPIPNALMQKHARTPFPLLVLWTLRALVLTLIGILIAHRVPESPQTIDTTPPKSARVIVLDISKSMETDDLSPSRIEYAKGLIKDYLSRSREFGLIIFAGKTFVLSPITHDLSGQNYLIETLTTDTINQSLDETSGTNIGDALIQASTLFHAETEKKHVLLITDGRANIGLDPLVAAEILKADTISVSVLALGSTTDIPLTHIVDGKREPLLDGSGNTINGSVDLATLTRIAESTSWSILNITRSDLPVDLDELFWAEAWANPKENRFTLDERTIVGLLSLIAMFYLVCSWFVWYRYKSR